MWNCGKTFARKEEHLLKSVNSVCCLCRCQLKYFCLMKYRMFAFVLYLSIIHRFFIWSERESFGVIRKQTLKANISSYYPIVLIMKKKHNFLSSHTSTKHTTNDTFTSPVDELFRYFFHYAQRLILNFRFDWNLAIMQKHISIYFRCIFFFWSFSFLWTGKQQIYRLLIKKRRKKRKNNILNVK